MTLSILDRPGGLRSDARRDRRHGEHAQMAGGPKDWSAAFGWSVQWSRMIARGETSSGVPLVQKWGEYIETMALDRVLDAWAAVVAAAETIVSVQLRPLSTDEVSATRESACAAEALQAAEAHFIRLNLRTNPYCRSSLKRLAAIAPKQAARWMELGACADELLARMGKAA